MYNFCKKQNPNWSKQNYLNQEIKLKFHFFDFLLLKEGKIEFFFASVKFLLRKQN